MAAIGRPHYINVRTNTVAKSDINELKSNGFKVLDAAYDLGVRYFDTALWTSRSITDRMVSRQK